MGKISYQEGYKYQLVEDYFHVLNSAFDNVTPFDEGFLKFTPSVLLIRKGYAWDGASGPAIDTKSIMRASLVHDALYQCMREHLISIDHKNECDRELQRICEQDGMLTVRSDVIYEAVKLFGYHSATKPREVFYAP